MITTTLNRIYACDPCNSGWDKLLAYLGKTEPDDEPLPYAVIVESNGIADAQWAMRCEPDHALIWQRYAIWCVRRVVYHSTDPRVAAALDVAEGYLDGTVSIEKLKEAAAAAEAAKAAAKAAAAAAAEAAWAAKAAETAAEAEAEYENAWTVFDPCALLEKLIVVGEGDAR